MSCLKIDETTPVAKLKNLGAKSALPLERIGITTYADLKSAGALQAFLKLEKLENFKPSLNFLYAMLGALENEHWAKYREQKGELLIELETMREYETLFYPPHIQPE
ncbi:TfoX/Sxy family DNA transformation protein [Aliikangiella sp. G2MR2-5]|uniref:TfoX/Sxy family DNA transformation protein n=1 Tax=Aliikangiella sp. G2MR2-5 TaxID=2788943 RepID=UPI0018AAE0B6|nr:TfoX/Sxy family DNA transformation protein [Aliikangiella sp. G2MR2-5]